MRHVKFTGRSRKVAVQAITRPWNGDCGEAGG